MLMLEGEEHFDAYLYNSFIHLFVVVLYFCTIMDL